MLSKLKTSIHLLVDSISRTSADLEPFLTSKSAPPPEHTDVILARKNGGTITLVGIGTRRHNLGWHQVNILKKALPITEAFTHWISLHDLRNFQSGNQSFPSYTIAGKPPQIVDVGPAHKDLK